MRLAIYDNIITVALTIAACIWGRFPSLCVIAGGTLLVLFSLACVDENDSLYIRLLQWIFIACFGIAAQQFFACSLYAVWKEKKLPLRFASAGVVYIIITVIFTKGEARLAKSILGLLLMYALAAFFYAIRRLFEWLEERSSETQNQIRISNLREMHEKQLNRKLVLQKFMADKNARLMERETISRNIHNSVGHSITAAVMTLDAADMLFDVSPEDARRKVNDANERIRGSLESIRRAVRVMDEEAKEVSLNDFLCEVETVADRFITDTTMRADILAPDPVPELMIPHEHVEFLIGALQEFLTNGAKHGHADRYLISVSADSANLRMEVKDNGHSEDFSEENARQKIEQGFGLKKIESYVKNAGGTCKFTNEEGFRATVTLPVLHEEEGGAL